MIDRELLEGKAHRHTTWESHVPKLTSPSVDFSEWYNQVVRQAELGCERHAMVTESAVLT